ncbi:hypothetical protein AVEN_267712-1 [Araneus ventricosus]|uniref:Uncharacterized protein n=1 Tax=Araneus ventricosus TaxID=182803 RepID=A0A4Y2CWI3_ARAVE|nr:hypothetical protein AVEN_267712-1 [Araneus ventricosus]
MGARRPGSIGASSKNAPAFPHFLPRNLLWWKKKMVVNVNVVKVGFVEAACYLARRPASIRSSIFYQLAYLKLCLVRFIRGQMTRVTSEQASPFPKFLASRAGGRFIFDSIFNVHQAHIHSRSLVDLGFEPGIPLTPTQGLTTRSPRSSNSLLERCKSILPPGLHSSLILY